MNSPLVSYKKLSPNNSGLRLQPIDRISPHCVAGQCSVESLGAWFAKSSIEASPNYGIGQDGRIGLYVEEQNRSWCTSSASNDNRAITIECASDNYHPYKMNDVVLNSLIELCIDICKRHNKDTLLWFNDKGKSLSYIPKSNEMIITVHRWFANKPCPGDWLYERLGYVAEQVTNALQEKEEEEIVTQDQFNEMMNNWLESQAAKGPSNWSEEARIWAESNGFIKGDEKGQKMYKKPLTREEFIQVLYRIENQKV